MSMGSRRFNVWVYGYKIRRWRKCCSRVRAFMVDLIFFEVALWSFYRSLVKNSKGFEPF